MLLDANSKVINQKAKAIEKAKNNASFGAGTEEIDVIEKIKNPMVETTPIPNQKTLRNHSEEKEKSIDISIGGKADDRMGRKFADVIRESGQINILFDDITIDNADKAK